MRKTTLALVLVATIIAPVAARADGDSVALATLLEAGRQYHPTLAKQPLLTQALAVQKSQINQLYMPRLALVGQASWQSDVTSINIPLPNVSITPPSKDQYKVALELQQSIWDGGVAAQQKRVAEQRAAVETEKVNTEWYQVRERIVQLYFAGAVQQELKHQAESVNQYLATVLEKAKVAKANGVIIERDVILVQARQLEARQAIVDADAQIASVRQLLTDLTGVVLPVSTKFASEAAACSATSGPSGAALATVHRPELAVLSAQQQLIAAQERLDNIADRPKVGAFATLGYGRPGLNALNDTFDTYFIGGVQLTVPLTYLYAGTHRKAQRQAELQQALLSKQQAAVLSQINVQLDTQRAEIARLDAGLLLDDELIGLRGKARQQTETQLALGTATMTDLVNDLTQEDQARSKQALHRAQRSLACHQLELAAGNL